jgi:hypothetical protein
LLAIQFKGKSIASKLAPTGSCFGLVATATRYWYIAKEKGMPEHPLFLLPGDYQACGLAVS